MPEGHSIHRHARRHQKLFAGQVVRVSSPQGRFAEGAALLDGAVFEGTEACGKHLFHRWSEGRWVHVHLGLFGTFREGLLPAPEPVGALRMRLEGEEAWLDLRGPTACEVISEEERDAIVARLGPDPLRRGEVPERATGRIGRSRQAIGALLMDQSVVAGIGNVYRAEVLFRHGVDPWLPGRELDPSLWEVMWADLVVLMTSGVKSGRIVTTEPEDRERPAGRVTRTDAHYVYRRTGQPCRRCGTPVRTAVMVARNLFWCPVCQGSDGPR